MGGRIAPDMGRQGGAGGGPQSQYPNIAPNMGQSSVPTPPKMAPPMPQGGPMGQQGPVQIPEGMNPRSVPGGPALGWRPQSLGSITSQMNELLQSNTHKQLMKDNSYYNKLYENLPDPIRFDFLKATKLLGKGMGLTEAKGQASFDAPQMTPMGGESSIPQIPGGGGMSQMPSIPNMGAAQDQIPKSQSYVEPAITPGLMNYTSPNADYSNMNPYIEKYAPEIMKGLRAKGWQPTIAEANRTQQEQAGKVAQGYSKTMNSKHLSGNAIDIIDKRYGWDEKHLDKIKAFRNDLMSEVQKYPELSSGGNWKGFGELGDWAHVQSNAQLYANKSTQLPSDIVKQFESFSEKPYWDHKQYSYGYGTKAPGPNGSISPEQATKLMEAHINKDRNILQKYAPDNLSDDQWNGILSFSYNLGPGKAKNLLKLMKQGDMGQAKQYLLGRTKASGKVLPGLVKRRQFEAKLIFGE
jgi:lysozyme